MTEFTNPSLDAITFLLKGAGREDLAKAFASFHMQRERFIETLRSGLLELDPATLGILFPEQRKAGGVLTVLSDGSVGWVFPAKETGVSLQDLRDQAMVLGIDISDLGRKKREIGARIDAELKRRQPFQEQIDAIIPKV